MRRFGPAERRARIGVRHRLAPSARGADPVAAAASVVALHGTDAASVYLSAWARTTGGDVAGVDRALYEDRTLVRILGMRRTMFVLPLDAAAVVHGACTRTVAARERRKLAVLLADSGVGDSDAGGWLRDVEEVALRVLHELGEASAADLAAADPRLGAEIVLSRGKSYEGRQKVASRVLFLLAADGRVVRGRPHGSWTSGRFRWTPWDSWCPDAPPEPPAEQAEAELARRWLHAFGPASPDDLRWWTGWNGRQTTRALTAAGAIGVDLDGDPGVVLADDLDPVPAPEPWAALLPALDPTPMGWTRREWFLGPYGPQLFDRTGNVSPTVWWNGAVIGGWAQRPDGEIRVRLLVDAGADAATAVDRAAADLRARLGDARPGARARGASAVERDLLA